LIYQFTIVNHHNKFVDKLGSTFLLPVEVIPMALAPVMRSLEKLGGKPELRMAAKKAGPVVTDQGNLVIDVKFDHIENPGEMEKTINNFPGVLENGLFVGVADLVLIGSVKEGKSSIRQF
ncbi:MAG: ribose-5-phosphate isomerase A, partial [Cyanobacteria bacterium J06558_2]